MFSFHIFLFFYLGHTGNFEKASKQTTDAFGVGYDYGSVMHYSANAFSKNGQPTIMPKVSKYVMYQVNIIKVCVLSRDDFTDGFAI